MEDNAIQKLKSLGVSEETLERLKATPIVNKLSEMILTAIVWKDSKEGYTFWKELHNKIKREEMKPKIICLYGGPGSGKSTTALRVCADLKMAGISCELNLEEIKDRIWRGDNLDDIQLELSSLHSIRDIKLMKAKVKYIITDAPLLLNTYYGEKVDKDYTTISTALLEYHHKKCIEFGYKVDHVFLNRTDSFEESGRIHTREEALRCDGEIKEFLNKRKINYYNVDVKKAHEYITKYIIGVIP